MKSLLKITSLFSLAAAAFIAIPSLQAEEVKKEKTKPEETKPEETSKAKWMDDYEAAVKLAKAENKLLLLDFTGSDWCGWCIKLKKEIFDQKEFVAYAEENLVLVELDFPRKKKLTESLQKQNKELAKKYGIRGYPTLIILNANEEQVGKLGYMKGGPAPFIQKLNELKK